MRDVIWAIDARNSTFGDLKLRMTEYANEMLPPLGIEFNLRSTGMPDEQVLSAEVRHGLILIFKEFVTNTIKHAQASRVDVDIERTRTEFRYTMRDNGRGADLTEASTGQGLQNMRMRAEKMGGDIELKATSGFSLTVVLNKV